MPPSNRQSHQSRRRFLKTVAYATGAAGVLSTPFVGPIFSPAQANPSGLPFQVPAQARARRNGNKVEFDLNIQAGQQEFIPAKMTPTLGFNGNYLGPLIRVRRGDRITVRTTNSLNVASTVHWHGMTLPANMDGGPHQSIQPGATWVSEFDIIQPAATLFYHSHAYHQTAPQVYAGLAGPLIIDDDLSDALDIPKEYGVDDLPVIIQDRDFEANGAFRYISTMGERMIGKHGSTILVNGVIAPLLTAQKTLLRLRLTNASNARFYRLAFSDRRPFQVIASDGGLLERPVTVRQLSMAPAERFDILVDLSDKKDLILQSLKGAGNVAFGPMRMMGFDQTMDILYIDARTAKTTGHTVPTTLTPPIDRTMPAIAATRKLNLEMGMMGMMAGGGFTINGQTMDLERVNFRLKKNTFEIWNLTNTSPMAHPLHIHNSQFRILSRGGLAPAAVESGFKDTVTIQAGEAVKILLPTGPYSDPKGYYMYHCHILEHEDGGMMGQFSVED